MAYTILNSDGTILTILAENQVDQITTNLTLVGRNYINYGEYINNNFIQLLANSANNSSNPPRNPLKGQLWYDTTAKRLKIYDSGFKILGGTEVSTTPPAEPVLGNLWWNNYTDQLFAWNGSKFSLVGPIYTKQINSSGWVVPDPAVKDEWNNTVNATTLWSYGEEMGLLYHDPVSKNLDVDSALRYFNTTTYTLVQGLNIKGNIKVTGEFISPMGPLTPGSGGVGYSGYSGYSGAAGSNGSGGSSNTYIFDGGSPISVYTYGPVFDCGGVV